MRCSTHGVLYCKAVLVKFVQIAGLGDRHRMDTYIFLCYIGIPWVNVPFAELFSWVGIREAV